MTASDASADVRRAGHMVEVRRGDDRLPARGEQLDQALAPGGVELRHDVVEQHQRRRATRLEEHVPLREEKRQEPEPLLPLGSVGAERPAGVSEQDLVAVGAVCREAPGEVLVATCGQLRAERVRVRGAAARPVGQRRLLRHPEVAARGRRSAGLRVRTPRLGPPSGSRPRRASSESQVSSRSGWAAPARTRAISAFRCASARLYAARFALRAGQSAATSWSRCARRSDGAPLTRSSLSGMKTLTSGRTSAPSGPAIGDPSRVHALRVTGLEAHLQPVGAVLGLHFDLDTGDLRAEADELTLVRGAAGARRAAEVEGLEQVRLAGAVRPVDHGDRIG